MSRAMTLKRTLDRTPLRHRLKVSLVAAPSLLGLLIAAGATGATGAASSRQQPPTVDDVITAVEAGELEELEARLLASNRRFELDGEALLRLDEAQVPARIIDLLVALSYPERFVVEHDGYTGRRPPPEVERGYGPIYAYPFTYFWWPSVHPYGFYYDPFYSPYHFHPRPPFRPPASPPDELADGRAVKGKGYTRIRRRPEPDSTGDGGSSRRQRGSSRYSGDGGGQSGGSGGSVSRGGYSGGGGGARTARPRN